MNKERKLLQRCLRIVKLTDANILADEVQALLAQPEQTEQEPVAWMYCWDDEHERTYVNLLTTDTEHKHLKTAFNVMPLYTSPPKREPLSEDDVTQIINTKHFDTSYTLQQSDKNNLRWYRQGVKDAGEAYGIGVDND